MLYENFVNVPKEYSIAPFWFWNDDLQPENLKWQMKEMHEKGVSEVVISSRLGIEIDYLSDEWFDRIETVVKYAEKLGMKIWLYDEDNWPSGYAGGKVLEENPDYCGKHLKRIADSENDQVVYQQDYTSWNPAYSESYYPDMLNRSATETFIKYTHQIYKTKVGQYFGNVIKGFFVDESGFYNNLQLIDIGDDGTIAWTDEFPAYFLKRNGYDITEKLPHLCATGERSIKLHIGKECAFSEFAQKCTDDAFASHQVLFILLSAVEKNNSFTHTLSLHLSA